MTEGEDGIRVLVNTVRDRTNREALSAAGSSPADQSAFAVPVIHTLLAYWRKFLVLFSKESSINKVFCRFLNEVPVE